MIHQIVKDSEKNGCSDKIEKIKTICQKHFTKLQRIKNTQSEIKPIKLEEDLEQLIVFGVKILLIILGHKK